MKQYTALVLTIFFSTNAFGMKKNDEEPPAIIRTNGGVVCPQPRPCMPGTTINLSELLSSELLSKEESIKHYQKDPKDATNYCILQNIPGGFQLRPYTVSLRKLHSKQYDWEVGKALYSAHIQNAVKPEHSLKQTYILHYALYIQQIGTQVKPIGYTILRKFK